MKSGLFHDHLGRLFYAFGPLFMLVFVLVLFGTMLGIQDVRDEMNRAEPGTRAGFWRTVRSTDFGSEDHYPGLKAFFSGRNFKVILTQTVVVAIGALGMTMIIVSGGIDLSVGSVVALTSVVGAASLVKGYPPTVAVLLIILVGGGIGLINGLIIAGLRMMPFIVTLGMMGIARGLAKGLAGNQTVNAPESSLNNLMAIGDPLNLFPLPPGVWIAAGLAAVTAVLMRQTIFGRYIFAIGSNEATARLCGIRVRLVKVLIYLIAGFLFGLGGLIQMSRLTQGDPTVAIGLELDIIAAVVIGGASLSGGTGSISGSMIGALIMAVLRNGSVLIGWQNYVQEIIIGVVIIIAVGLDRFRQRKSETQ